MLERITQITGHRYSENDPILLDVLRRIQRKLPEDADTFPAGRFAAEVMTAEAVVNAEGNLMISNFIKQITAPPKEKVLLIKSSPKGVRIKIAATNGIRYSFGPIWNASVSKGKGIAFSEANREKLNHQAMLAGIKDPEVMDIQALGVAIAATF